MPFRHGVGAPQKYCSDIKYCYRKNNICEADGQQMELPFNNLYNKEDNCQNNTSYAKSEHDKTLMDVFMPFLATRRTSSDVGDDVLAATCASPCIIGYRQRFAYERPETHGADGEQKMQGVINAV